jgi:hypothetical protein
MMIRDPDGSWFVGRLDEVARISTALQGGRNLLLTGAYGIGRTALLRQVARGLGPEWHWHFLDGAGTPAELGRQLVERFSPRKPLLTRKARSLAHQDRHRLESASVTNGLMSVIVLDDLIKLTRPKLAFCRWLAGLGRYRIIAVPEVSIPREGMERLRTALYPSIRVHLDHLPASAARRFFEAYAERNHLPWTRDHIHGLVLATHGYPLGMWQILQGVHTEADPIPAALSTEAPRRAE